MASSKDYVKDMEKLVECGICLDRLNNPKDLICSHSFCKSCIEDILEFRPNKCAVIRCPMRCEKVTIIKPNKTVNDLTTSIHLKQIIEYLSDEQDTDNQGKHRCINSPDCKRIACYYCKVCYKKMCQACKDNHMHNDDNNNVEFVSFMCNEKDQHEIVPWCDEHSTYARYKCEDGFICHYCKTRSHAKHTFHKIDKLYDEIHTWVMNKQLQVGNVEELFVKA